MYVTRQPLDNCDNPLGQQIENALDSYQATGTIHPSSCSSDERYPSLVISSTFYTFGVWSFLFPYPIITSSPASAISANVEFSRFFIIPSIPAEGAFKKLKPEPNSGLSSVSGSISSPGSGISSLPQHAGHTPTTASCPTPARRRHRTTFTQVCFVAILWVCVCFNVTRMCSRNLRWWCEEAKSSIFKS